MKINLPDINWNDEIGEVFDKITVLTLKDAEECINIEIKALHEDFVRGKLEDFQRDDYTNDLKTLEALKVVIRYFGG